jgi:hypothetical protein
VVNHVRFGTCWHRFKRKGNPRLDLVCFFMSGPLKGIQVVSFEVFVYNRIGKILAPQGLATKTK